MSVWYQVYYRHRRTGELAHDLVYFRASINSLRWSPSWQALYVVKVLPK